MRYRLMASYLAASYQAAVGPSDRDVTLFAAPPPPEEHGFSPAPGGIWRKQVRLDELDGLWESRPIGSYHGEPCLVLDDLGDRLHIVYLGMDERRAAQLGYWEVDRGVFEVVVPRHDITDLAEERHEFPITLLLSALPAPPRALSAADPGGWSGPPSLGQAGSRQPGPGQPGPGAPWPGPSAGTAPAGPSQLPAAGPAQFPPSARPTVGQLPVMGQPPAGTPAQVPLTPGQPQALTSGYQPPAGAWAGNGPAGAAPPGQLGQNAFNGARAPGGFAAPGQPPATPQLPVAPPAGMPPAGASLPYPQPGAGQPFSGAVSLPALPPAADQQQGTAMPVTPLAAPYAGAGLAQPANGVPPMGAPLPASPAPLPSPPAQGPQAPGPLAPGQPLASPPAPSAVTAWHGSPAADGTWYYQPGYDAPPGEAVAGFANGRAVPNGYARPEGYGQSGPPLPGPGYQPASFGQPAPAGLNPLNMQQVAGGQLAPPLTQSAPQPTLPTAAPVLPSAPSLPPGLTATGATGATGPVTAPQLAAPVQVPAPPATAPGLPQPRVTTGPQAAAPSPPEIAPATSGPLSALPGDRGTAQAAQPGLSPATALSKLTGAVRGRRAARKPRLAMSAIFADLVDMADIPRSAYAVDEEVTGAMCLFKTEGGYEVFSCAEDARHEVRFFEDEEAAYFYLFGVLAAEALRNGRLSPQRG